MLHFYQVTLELLEIILEVVLEVLEYQMYENKVLCTRNGFVLASLHCFVHVSKGNFEFASRLFFVISLCFPICKSAKLKKELSRTPEPKRHSLLLNDVAPLRHVQTVKEL